MRSYRCHADFARAAFISTSVKDEKRSSSLCVFILNPSLSQQQVNSSRDPSVQISLYFQIATAKQDKTLSQICLEILSRFCLTN